jgi:hypothetical protein
MANGQAGELLGEKEARLIGKALSSLCNARDRGAVQEILDRLSKTRLTEVQQVVVHLNNSEVELRLASTVEDGECAGILCTMGPAVAAARDRKEPPSREAGRAPKGAR